MAPRASDRRGWCNDAERGGAEITALINERVFLSLKAPVERVTGFDVPFPLYKLEDYYLPSINRIIKGIEKVASF